MKINDKEFLNPQQQLYQNTKDIEELKEKYKNEIYAVKPFSEWPEDAVLPEVEDPRDFTYVPRSITNVPADAKYGYLLINVENSFEPADSAALFYKIKSVNNSTVYIEFYANVASHVPGPQGPAGADSTVPGPQGPQGNSIFSCDANLDPTPDELTAVSTALIHKGSSTLKVGDIIVGVDGIFGYLSSVGQITSFVTTVGSLKGPQGTATIGIQVVATLPSTGTEGVIYLVPAEDPETGNAYDEYIYTNNAWEKFGYLNIDLTNYALKSEIPVVNEGFVPKTNYAYDLGSSTKLYKNLYVGGIKNTYFNILTGGVNDHGTAVIYSTNAQGTTEGSLRLDYNKIQVNQNLVPSANNTLDLGTTGLKYKDLYLAGSLKDGTNSIAIADIATTDQLFSGDYNDLSNKPDLSIYAESADLGTAASCDTGTSSGDVPVLDANGKLSTSVLPAIAVTDTFVVASEAAMLALTAEVGDIAVRTDLNKSFILQTADASVLSHWQELLTPTDSVTSVNGQTGAVTLTIPSVPITEIQLNGTTKNPNNGVVNLSGIITSTGEQTIMGPKTFWDVKILGVQQDEPIQVDFTHNSDTSEGLLFKVNNDYYGYFLPTAYSFTGNKTIATTDQLPNLSNYIQKSSTAGLVKNDGTIDTNTYLTSAPVTSVNGHTGSVTVTQSDLNIVYSSNQPSNPVNGTIWIKPTN